MRPISKITLLFSFMMIVLLSSFKVSAWATINREINVTVFATSESFLVEVLMPVETAPILSDSQMNALIDSEYESASFKDAMNGYRDEEGYASSQLYSGITILTSQSNEHVFFFGLDYEADLTYKIAVIFEDGSMITSSAITQTLYSGNVTFDMNTITIQEANWVPTSLPFEEPGWQYYAFKIIFSIVTALLILGIELFICYYFGYRTKLFYWFAGMLSIILYFIMNVFMWIRDETMYIDFSFFWPYIMILFFAILIVIAAKVVAVKFPQKNPLIALLYVIIAHAIIIIITAYSYGMAGFFF